MEIFNYHNHVIFSFSDKINKDLIFQIITEMESSLKAQQLHGPI